MPDNLLPPTLDAGQLRTFIDFDGKQGATGASAQSTAQSEGTAALWHLLHHMGYAYMADEVGMGKTRQSMAVIALQMLQDPRSQVVIICPGRTLQEQWIREWDAFLRTCYRLADDRLVSTRTHEPLAVMNVHERLSDFAHALHLGDRRIHLLRYSSFSRPLIFCSMGDDIETGDALLAEYVAALTLFGATASADDLALPEKVRASAKPEEQWRETLTTELNERYAGHLGQLLKARGMHLAVFDEAQYLRHVGNQQNRHILKIFRPHTQRWLFLSATPLHSGTQSLLCLDHYLEAPEPQQGAGCGEVDQPKRQAPRIRERLREDQDAGNRMDVVDIMKEFMVRRIRSYSDASSKTYRKTEYRRYSRVRTSGAEDPLTALTMALVQKQLVQALHGKNNRFRQGECSSFESLSSSVHAHERRQARGAPPPTEGGNLPPGQELESNASHRTIEEVLDRSSIDALTASFNERAAPLRLPAADPAHSETHPLALPHAKLNEVVRQVAERSLKDGSTEKSLVFVRRIDTVEEMRDALFVEFQHEVDRRLDIWRVWLAGSAPDAMKKNAPWDADDFWRAGANQGDDAQDTTSERKATAPGDGPGAGDDDTGAVDISLDYFKALQATREGPRGMLVSFRAQLLRKASENPLNGFLRPRPDGNTTENNDVWEEAEARWRALVALCTGHDETAQRQADHPLRWAVAAAPLDTPMYFRRATLMLCILQSLRQTDFIVDLYVMNHYLHAPGDTKATNARTDLASLLLHFLATGMSGVDSLFPMALSAYATNWRQRIRDWIVHFDVIVDKSLRGRNVTHWKDIHEHTATAFNRMQPVFGRSGQLNDQNAVPQFKFPTHPNVLVCTDVLKEGVDLHLFCDEVVHYGVAWTSGDLEQRIGRVDRFGSLISRRLEGHWPPALMPLLGVKFPYLHGTLDALQVERVILAKIRSDLRMDLGRRRDEMGKISIDDLSKPADPVMSESTLPDSPFFPDMPPTDPNGQIPADLASMLRGNALDPDRSREALHFPHLAAVRVRLGSVSSRLSGSSESSASSDSSVTVSKQRHLLRTGPSRGKAKKSTAQLEGLIPEQLADQVDPVALVALEQALQGGGPVSVETLDDALHFRFDARYGTQVFMATADLPLAAQAPEPQPVLLERIGDCWLLRSPLCAAQEAHKADWLFRNSLDWAWLARDAGIVWLMQFVITPAGADAPLATLEQLAARLGTVVAAQKVALCAPAAGAALPAYRCLSALPVIALPDAFQFNKQETSMSDAHWDQSGRFLSHIQTWFHRAFSEVLQSVDAEGTHTISDMVMRQDGVLQLITEGPARMRLQAFLDLGSARESAAHDGPWMIWELIVTTATSGALPNLRASPWEEMPHKDAKAWDGDERDDSRAYTSTWGDHYRYAAVYHRPKDWDRHSTSLSQAWGYASHSMTRNSNFMKHGLRTAFHEAVQRRAR